MQAGLLQGVWWITAALLSLPFGAWLLAVPACSRLTLAALLLGAPFLFVQALAAGGFWLLFVGRLGFILFHTVNTPARALLLHQWVAPRGIMRWCSRWGFRSIACCWRLAVSLSPWLIEGLGSWRIAYGVWGGVFA